MFSSGCVLVMAVLSGVPGAAWEEGIPDPVLREALCEALEVDSLASVDDYGAIDVLVLSASGKIDLAGIGHADQLRVLRVYGAKLEDLRPLLKLQRLEELVFQGCGIDDVSWIAEMPTLKHVTLSYNAISDAGPVLSLPELRMADLSNNRIIALVSPEKAKRPEMLRRLDVRSNPLDADAIDECAELGWEVVRPDDLASAPIMAQQSDRFCTSKPVVMVGEKRSDEIPEARLVHLKSVVAKECVDYPFVYQEGIAFPAFGRLPTPVREALAHLSATDEVDYLADTALVLVRFAYALAEISAPGFPIGEVYNVDADGNIVRRGSGKRVIQTSANQELLLLFLSKIDTGAITILSNDLARWIDEHRNMFGPSLLLDEAIDEFRVGEQRNLDRILPRSNP